METFQASKWRGIKHFVLWLYLPFMTLFCGLIVLMAFTVFAEDQRMWKN